MYHLGCSRMWISVTRGVKYGEGSDQIVRTGQGVLLIPGKVSKVEESERAVSDDKSN